MECSQDLTCQLIDWFSGSAYALRQTFEALDLLWNAAGGGITKFFEEHGEKLVAMASFSFAVYRWWVYRERILYKRLEEYIRESDGRLGPTTSEMMEAVLRPGQAAALRRPLYAVELTEILDRNRWRRFFGFTPVDIQAERQLRRAMIGIGKRERTIETASRSLQRQRAEVHMLRGSIATSRARQSRDAAETAKYDGRALREFQRALQTSTHKHDVEAKECEALQFLRLGRRDLADEAFKELEDFASSLEDAERRDLTIARARRYRAQIAQANAPGG